MERNFSASPIMERNFVVNSTGVLKKVLLCRPDYIEIEPIDEISKSWYEKEYEINKEECIKEHEELVQAYQQNGIEVILIDGKPKLKNQVFSRDFGATIKEGYILGNFKETVRKEETKEYEDKLKELEIPCVAKCEKGVFEGGDFWFLDDKTIAIGTVDRTNLEGIEEIRRQIERFGYEVIAARAEKGNLHLDMCFNVVAERLAVACVEVLSQDFLRVLKEKKFQLIDVPKEGIAKHYCNIEALGNNKVMSFYNNKKVNEKLEAYGIEVIKISLNELLKSGGGIHCMTFPIIRE
ncbi:N-dimethylarginine dimethylaminohydrolase [Clostridium acetobutylicum]|uniref:N-dimethylarginine dimethylaminohydrolase (Similar to ykgA B.subtilis) n=1 Tax=Clostridium acetobutylicum (strain ATCC 824 / DSM 792 / JCM 1419 / IAM 19013 / LMG 5710 / NBRC 13948 / NRRL B-527 / VKM B-1787 / 2291 / W) TaxID=272562 RepID=Q97M24_CLOAB|nr:MULTISPECIES: dimethylarginine dimethylaminohydrolase family protein [Clostridium]AAK78356.1 N-dimethylarginine dimethylaminohydrolase (similar to ykgA B.subtilis) [Clostridium acetobutylicum ATCC 824]ADZ19425.1 N-dimethylarginine dimethylaminohydrolase [Clostridium acetobutylicum EA 2018]AEI31206.1 N-dimethylarginine [Clostridium acetobutylicum DSM 1731]AWV80080.1 nitrate reductase [Clostridium acetobutylicum]MBC2395902.1 nitrate reductase [Clostridium acetobutylicum]